MNLKGAKFKSPWWMKPLRFFYRKFGVIVVTMRDTPDVHWMLAIYKVRKEK